jgi:tyrosine-protein kinase Etk/Wzc
MSEYKQLDLQDYLIFLNKWKKKLILIFCIVLLASYITIYFTIPEKFDASSTIIPSEGGGINGFASLMKNFSGLPLNLSGLGKSQGVNFYNTIIYSRTNLEKVIRKFDLYKEYNLHSWEYTLKELTKNITTNESESDAYQITVRGSSRQQAADMANYCVDQLNKTVIQLNVQKSHDNRVFIQTRYDEIRQNLSMSEDSLKIFQKKSNFYSALDQGKAMIESYSKLESNLQVKQLEYSIFKKIYGSETPITKNAQITLDEYESQLKSLKNDNSGNNVLLPIHSLPDNALNFFRLTRNIKIYETMLEFIVPVLEEAKFDEQKNVPMLQVIDKAVPPEKRSYPKRVVTSLAISLFVSFIFLLILTVRELIKNSTNEKIIYLRKEFFKFRKA